MGTETHQENISYPRSVNYKVKLNNLLMGTETCVPYLIRLSQQPY